MIETNNKLKIINRKCVLTNKIMPRENMYRIVKFNNQIYLDLTYKAKGRGLYISKSEYNFDTFYKKRVLNRAFRINVENSVYNKIGEEVENYGK
ncbi:hypothetical protein EI74_0292 [Mycoplasma testudineum]|uniref:YlxR domain-containing protein n=1 Tax=Mycoplasma testudineum TaxID=244584 RepID=A0A4R6IEQ2_9MOLU|nr:YlxR family protein [Mycoplasma testudineum]TDO20464.1 hypothetical protein EI74_0292 [Mycoplasma testudineum]